MDPQARPPTADVDWCAAPTLVAPTLPGRPGPSGSGPPTRLGRYEVARELGRGGMGTVFEGRDPKLGRRVALKRLHDTRCASKTSRLIREARALAKLSHPHVVQIYEVGEHAGQWFIAMELVDGQTLRAWQRTGPGWRECVEVYAQAGAGLAAAHAAGLTHRDFKPDNCIIDEQGRVRVLDFGLVRSPEDADADPLASTADSLELASPCTKLTRAGALLGTPGYMSLEQIDGRTTDARSDQFSFCVALYEALYGERPFPTDSLTKMMVAVKTGAVPAAPRGSTVPTALRRVVLRGLAADPADRWDSMDALLRQLRGLLDTRRRRRTWPQLGLSAILSVLSVFGVPTSYGTADSAPLASTTTAGEGSSGRASDDAALLVSGAWDRAETWFGVPLGEATSSAFPSTHADLQWSAHDRSW